MFSNMEEGSPMKRRRTENVNDTSTHGKISKQWLANVEISPVSVKPDKFQKLRRIAASCTEKIQNPKTDEFIISSAGSSPGSSPRPEHLAALSNPVDASELYARLTVLVKEDDKENLVLKSENENLQIGEVGKEVKSSEDDGKAQPMDKNMNIPMGVEEFYAVLRKMVNDKMKKLEESYNETIIPDLEKKIAVLENENRYLQEHAKNLQEMFTKVVKEKQQQQQKPDQQHVGVQVGSTEPPRLTPVVSSIHTVTLPSKTLPSKPAPVVHVIDSGVYESPSTTLPYATQVSTLAGTLRGPSVPNGIRHTAVAATGHVYTSSAGQPRMFSEAPYKPGSHPNAVVAPRPHTTFVRPAAPITATVYPQPQSVPTSPSTLGALRTSPPTQPSLNRFPYNPQAPNGVMIRTPTQPTVQYVVNPERKDISTGQPMGPRQKTPQGPPPCYSVAAARVNKQVPYHPGSVTNPAQVNGVRHYAVRQGAPSGGMVGSPAGPPPLVRAEPSVRPQVNSSPRYQAHNLIRQRPPYPNTPGNDPRAQVTAAPPRHPNVLPIPPQSSPTQTNGFTDLPPPTPTVSISGASSGIVLSWNMAIPEGCAPIDSYQLFAYQNNGKAANSPSLWKKLGIVKALPLPMACTLTQFMSGSMYYFAVRAIDIRGRAGGYSSPCAITLPSEGEKGRSVT